MDFFGCGLDHNRIDINELFCHSERFKHANEFNSIQRTNKKEPATERKTRRKGKSVFYGSCKFTSVIKCFVRASASQLKGNINYGKHLAHLY